ncbi:hypothetical protein P8452_25498 [Trifolium repens]|nr:hypothetical protein P8452_25498 [Trifolium repens]
MIYLSRKLSYKYYRWFMTVAVPCNTFPFCDRCSILYIYEESFIFLISILTQFLTYTQHLHQRYFTFSAGRTADVVSVAAMSLTFETFLIKLLSNLGFVHTFSIHP